MLSRLHESRLYLTDSSFKTYAMINVSVFTSCASCGCTRWDERLKCVGPNGWFDPDVLDESIGAAAKKIQEEQNAGSEKQRTTKLRRRF